MTTEEENSLLEMEKAFKKWDQQQPPELYMSKEAYIDWIINYKAPERAKLIFAMALGIDIGSTEVEQRTQN